MSVLLAGIASFGGALPPGRPLVECVRAAGLGGYDAVPVARGDYVALRAAPDRQPPLLTGNGNVLAGDLDIAWWRGAAGHPRKPVAQEALAHALIEDREAAAARLDGEYAFAVWHAADQVLQLSIDGAGVRPLYYVHRPGAFAAFASMLPVLLAAGLEDHGLNHEVIAKLATSNFAHGGQTQFTHISRVGPGETVLLTPDRVEHRRHWRLVCRDPFSPKDDRQAVMGELRGHLDQAVRRRLPATGPVFTHLSGGLDSSAIAVLAARAAAETGQPVRAYAFGPRDLPDDGRGAIPVVDEWPAIDAILAQYPGIDLQTLRTPDHEMLAHAPINPVFPIVGGPTDLYEQAVRDAAAHGAGTVLSGWGGDEVVSYAGAGGFAEMLIRLRWRNLWQVTRAIQRRTGRHALRTILSEAQRYVRPALFPFVRGQSIGRSNRAVAGLNQFVRGPMRGLAEQDAPLVRPDSAWMRVQRLGFGHMAWMNALAAQIAGAHGVRYSTPLMDRDLIEFAIRLPPEFLHLDGLMRAGLREPMAGLLPDEARLRRSKLHFDPAAGYIFARDAAALRERARELEGTIAEQVLEIGEILAILDDMPTPESVHERIREAAGRGEQHFLSEARIALPLTLGRFMCAAEALLADLRAKG